MKGNSYIKIIITVLFALIIDKATGQKVLFPIAINRSNASYIAQFDISNCKFDTICKRILQPPPSPPSVDFAITPSGDIYSSEEGNGFYIEYVGKYNEMIPGRNDIHYSGFTYITKVNDYNVLAAILSNNKGELLLLSIDLIKYYPKEKKWEYKGIIPNFYKNDSYVSSQLHVFNRAAAGSLTRVYNNFYFITAGQRKYSGDIFHPQKLIQLDTQNVDQSKEIKTYGDTIEITGMFTIRNSCDNYTSYVTFNKYRDSLSAPLYWAFGEIDVQTGQIIEICTKRDSTNNIYYLLQAGVPWTILDSDCIVTVDLDLDNSSGATGKLDFADTSGCRFDSIYLADIDPEVFSKTYIDSMQIFFAGAVPDGANEYLEVSNPGGLQLHWRNPRFLTVINNTNDDFLPMEVVVRSIKYRNVSQVPTFGERKIAFVAFSGKRQSDTAYSHLVLIDDFPQAGRDTFINLCATDAPVYLDSLLSPDAERQGQWQGVTMQAGVFDPAIDQSGIFRYIVTKPGCTADTALIDINVNQSPEFDLGNDTSICIGGQIVLQCEIDGAQYLWQDGSTDQNLTVSDSGTYVLTVVDDEGCSYTDSIKITYYPDTNTKAEIDSTVCNDETFVWNNMNINSEGDYEYTTANKYGCDSLTILHLTYYPVTDVEIYGETMFCKGDTVILQASDMSRYLWSTGDTSAQIEVAQQGWYYLNASDQNGCTATDSIYIEQIPALDIQINTLDESCYNAQDGKISITYISGGVGTIRYYIDNTPVNNGDTLRDLSPGDYTISAIDSFGCEWSAEMSIESAPQLWVSLGDDIIVTTTDTIISIEAENNFTTIQKIQWYIDGQLIDNDKDYYEFLPSKDTQIEVVLTDDNGCTQSDTLNIRLNITEEEIEIYIPDIFSPDGDGLNDIWSISSDKAISEIENISIYDRWGEQIYSKEHIPIDRYRTDLWDGSYKGQKVNPGVYVYILRLKTYDGKQIVKAGDITVVR